MCGVSDVAEAVATRKDRFVKRYELNTSDSARYVLFMAALWNRASRCIFALWFLSFFLLPFSFFSLPNLSGRRLDVYHTSTHGVALVRIYAGLKCAAGSSLKMRTQKIANNSACEDHRTILWGYIFTIKAHIDNRKKLVKQQYLPTCPYMVNFGLLAAEIVSLVWAP